MRAVPLCLSEKLQILQSKGDVFGDTMGGIGFSTLRIPQVVGNKLQDQRHGRRPGQGLSPRGQAPAFQIGTIGGQRSQGIFANAFLCQVAQGGDVLFTEQSHQLIRALRTGKGRQDGGKRIQRFRLARRAFVKGCGRGGREAIGHGLSTSQGQNRSLHSGMRLRKSLIIDKGYLSLFMILS